MKQTTCFDFILAIKEQDKKKLNLYGTWIMSFMERLMPIVCTYIKKSTI